MNQLTISPSSKIEDKDLLVYRLSCLSNLSLQILAQTLQVPAEQVIEHPEFISEGNKMIDRITF